MILFNFLRTRIRIQTSVAWTFMNEEHEIGKHNVHDKSKRRLPFQALFLWAGRTTRTLVVYIY